MQGKLESGVQTFSRKERGQEKVLKSNLDLGFSKFSEEESKWNPTSGCLYCRLAAFSVAIMLCDTTIIYYEAMAFWVTFEARKLVTAVIGQVECAVLGT